MLQKFLKCLAFLILLELSKCQTYKDRPKIKTTDGDLIVEAALDKNIYLRPNGPKSSIYFGNINMLNINLSSSTWSNPPYPTEDTDRNMNSILRRLDRLEGRFYVNDLFPNITFIQRRLNRLANRISSIESRLEDMNRDKCQSHPCQHGGTCLNGINDYFCQCPPNWEGKNCDEDVNECRNFAGTDLGCQNGATCINKPGAYECLCRNGWFGLHCTRKLKDCSGGDFEMCGHGHCIPTTSAEGISCLCEQGWTNNGSGVACLTDVNECDLVTNGPRCSVNPRVDCINLPGSFRCGQCPPGYEGDGYICFDVDECITVPNGGCSTNPMVSCHNTIGSRICGPCPPGYVGNGITCTWRGACNINRGGCHPSARCIDNAALGGQLAQCICPEGMEGNGIGVNGCYISNNNSTQRCQNNPCGNRGHCVPLLVGYTCICFRGYSGTNCESLSNNCNNNPCQNGGSCKTDDSTNRGFRCECTAQYSGELCQIMERSCGGVLNEEEGSIIYPLTNNSYRHNARCAWIIRTLPDKVINVTFSKFNLEYNPDCMYDFLQIHDGRSSASQLLGRFCGDDFPLGGNIISSHNNLYFWFRSDESVAKDGFALHWNSISPVCGGEIEVMTNGRISSPGSPGKYPPNRDCYWNLSARPNKRIQIHFFELDLETHFNCSYDYLAIYDGIDSSYPLLEKLCNSSLPGIIQSSGSEMYIHFHSDEYGSGKGFQISFVSVDGIPGCGGLYTGDKGQIVSPSFEGKYLNNLFCEYKIKTGTGTKIRLDFKSFRLETSFRCVYDYLKVYDGPSSESSLVGSFCGTTYPKSYTSSSNALLIIFKTDSSMPYDGFTINYKAVCEQNIIGDSGIIKSPGYPISYPKNQRCNYILITSPGKAILLTFQDFNIEDNSNMRCIYDYLEVRDGPDANSTLLGKYCGTNNPPPQTSSYNYMHLKFESDMSISRAGFYANYTSIDIECGGIYRNSPGNISHPAQNYGNDNNFYKNNQHCVWIIIATPGMHIELTWNEFDIEESSSCSFDYVQVIEIGDSNNEHFLGTYCGSKRPPTFTTITSRLKLKFESDSSVKNSGFSVSYSFLDDRTNCGGRYHRVQGSIYSPGWPSRYEANHECIWVITVPVGQQISLNISQFDLERPIRNRCDLGDYLEIRNGGNSNSSLIGQFCGSFDSKHFVSLSNSIYLKFHSDVYLSGNGFKIEWDGTITGCGGLLTSSSGIITSPNYPDKYHNNAYCLYKIVTSYGSRIKITFNDIELEHSNDCYYDYVEIYDGKDESSPSLGKYCEMSSKLNNIVATNNVAFIKFRSDYSIGLKGFSLRFDTICNNNLSGIYGVIESPEFPNNYKRNLNCLWTVTVPKGNKINVTFTHFDIYRQPFSAYNRYLSYNMSNFLARRRQDNFPMHRDIYGNCGSDYVQYKETSDTNYTEKLCGSIIPPSFSSKSNSLELKFVTTSFTAHAGFRLEWVRHGCGGHITKSFGHFSFDKSLTSNEEIVCEWLIETPLGKSVSITFTDMYMSETVNCTSDSLEIYNGANNKSPLLTKICQKSGSSTMSSSNFMTIIFTKKSSLRDIHFAANFVSVDSKCGGFIESNSGYIQSENYPKDYDNNIDCMWSIKVPDHHRIEFNIMDLDLYSNEYDTPELCADNIKIYDGNDLVGVNYSTLICPQSNMTRFISKSNRATIQFTSDYDGVAKGFKANFSAVCGGIIQASNDGILDVNKLDNLHSTDINCTWTIIASKFDQKISLTITHMSIPINRNVTTNRRCSSSFLKVFDGDDVNAPIFDEFCGRKVPPMLVSHSSSITLQLGSYTSRVSGLFSAHYTTLLASCGGVLTSEEGTIASPNYPDPYPANADCEWVLNTSPGNKVYLTFEKLDISYSEGCNEDYLEIRENSGGGNLLGIYCDNSIRKNITISSKIYIKFHSDDKSSGQGFILHYGFVHGNEISSIDRGEITSPLYPLMYDGPAEYSWRIYFSGTEKINIIIDVLQISVHGESCYNYLAVYDGYDEEAPLLGEFCGIIRNDQRALQSTSSVVYIKLKLDERNTGSQFHLIWEKSDMLIETGKDSRNCGYNETRYVRPGEIIIISSPNYPEIYNSNDNCEWIFKSDIGRHLSLVLMNFHIEQTPGCFADTLSIYSSENGLVWTPIQENICSSTFEGMQSNASLFMKVYFKSDMSVEREGFRASIKSVCGGSLLGPSGVVEPLWSDVNSGSLNKRCDWKIKVRPGRTINLYFDHFNITNPGNQCLSYILIRNGDSEDAPLLLNGRYCGFSYETHEKLESSSNSVFVTYNYKKMFNENYEGFKLRYEEKSAECGVTSALNLDHSWEIISSPNYPRVPLPYSECSWIFSGPPGEVLRLDFVDRFDIMKSSNNVCDLEFIEVHDGLTELSPLIGKFCGANPGTIKTTNNFINIKYVTQLKEPRDGLKANISIDACGGTIISSSGIITSPNYPHLQVYPPGSVCEWHIIGSPGFVFQITAIDISFPEAETSCGNKLTIEEYLPISNSTGVSTLKTFCSEDYFDSDSIQTSTNNVSVKVFTGIPNKWSTLSDYKGFKLSYNSTRKLCGGTINSPNGYLQTPGYPQETSLRFCQWIINVPDTTRRVKLELLYTGVDSGQDKQRIMIFNDKGFRSLIKSISKETYSPSMRVFESSGNELGVYVLLLPTASTHIFQAKFSSYDEAICGGRLSGLTGEIRSPIIDRSYVCNWALDSKHDLDESAYSLYNTLYMTVSLNTSYSRSFCTSLSPTLNIQSNINGNHYRFIRDICSVKEESYVIPSTEVSLMAMKRENDTLNFKLNWKLQPCGGIIHVTDTSVNILNIPNIINSTLDCSWILLVPPGNRVEIKLEGSFRLNCDIEFIKIYRGANSVSPAVGDYCKDAIPEKPLLAKYRLLYIVYHSEVRNETNLMLSVRTVEHQCGGLLSKFDYSFASPNYPKSYYDNQECTWEIQADTGNRVSLNFVDRFAIEDRPNCTKDVVVIYDWKLEVYQEIARLCGRNLPPTFNSTSNLMKVVLRTDNETHLDGFRAEITYICGGVFEASHQPQYLFTPGYPYVYKPNLDCTYKVSAPYEKILFEFVNFDLEGNYPDCDFDNVTIVTKDNIATYCGKKKPPVIIGEDEISVTLKTDRDGNRRGFKLIYSIYSCGGNVTNPTVLTAGTSDKYNNNMNCTWLITAPENKVVVLKILFVDLEGGAYCYSDYLDIYNNALIDSEERLARLCGNINTTTVLRSTGDSMVVQFISDSYLTYKGFRVEVFFTYSESVGCGGRIDLTTKYSHTLTSPLYEGHTVYENFLDCHWTVLAALDKVIHVEFLSFHIAPCGGVNQTALGISNCNCDFVEIIDGFNPHSLAIGTYCGHTLPPELTSSENKMSIRLSTDGDYQSAGFQIHLTVSESVCGVTAYEVGENNTIKLKSPGYDLGVIPRGLYCSYHFVAKSENYENSVRIHLKSLNIKPETNKYICSKDKLVVRSSPLKYNASVGQNYILHKARDSFFYNHYDSYISDFSLPDQFELCGLKSGLEFYMKENFNIDIWTSPDEEESTVYRGFEIDISFIGFCGRNYTEPQGKIVSDFIGSGLFKTNKIRDCFTLITALENNTISVYFLSVIPDYYNDDIFLDIYDGNSTNSPKIIRISQNYLDNLPLFSTSRYLLLHSHIDDEAGVSFDLNYMTTDKGRGCGGRLHNVLGTVTSPLYPEVYRQRGSCEWQLETPTGTRLLLHFSVFDLGRLCDQNYVKLVKRDGSTVSTYCSEMPANYLSDDNYVKIVFITSMNNGGTGWVADFVAVK